MTSNFYITTVMHSSAGNHWISTEMIKSEDEGGNEVVESRLLDGENALAHKSMGTIARYQAFLEEQKQAHIALAKRLLTTEVN